MQGILCPLLDKKMYMFNYDKVKTHVQIDQNVSRFK